MQTNVDGSECGQKIYRSAIRYLSYREHGVKELRLKLRNKFEEQNEIDRVLSQLIKENLLSEQRYAESYIRSRVSKGCGPERIRFELLQKGVESTFVEDALALSEVAWDEEIRKVWFKKYGENRTNDLQNKANQWRFLQYRGFSSEQIKALLDVIY